MDADVHVLFLLREQLFFSFSSLLPLWFVLFFLLFVLNNDGVSKRMETGKWILGKRVVSGRGLSRGGMDEGGEDRSWAGFCFVSPLPIIHNVL